MTVFRVHSAVFSGSASPQSEMLTDGEEAALIPIDSGGSVNPYSQEHELCDAFARGDLAQVEAMMLGDRYPREYPLHAACEVGDIALVREFLNATPAWINGSDFLGMSPLHAAACTGKMAVVEELINRDAPLAARDVTEGLTPLHLAVQNGHLEVAMLLARAGAPIRSGDRRGITPLALADQRPDISEALLRGEDDATRMRTGQSRLGSAHCGFNGALPEAIVRRDRAMLDSLLARAEVDTRRRSLSLSDCLFKYGVHPGLLAGTAASWDKSAQFEAMRMMVELGDIPGLAFFHLIGCDPRTSGDGGNTLLHYAARYRRPQAIDLLVQRAGLGDLINVRNNSGQTPLDIVRAEQHIDARTEQALLENAAWVDAQ